MKNKLVAFFIAVSIFGSANAQINTDVIFGKVKDLLAGKQLLNVKKGFSPKFSLGKLSLNKVGILGEQLKGINVLGKVFDTKNSQNITKLFKTYKTGLVVYKVLGGLGTAVTTYSTVRGLVGTEKFDAKTVRQLLAPAIGTLVTGVVTKLLTKKASYKAVDIFNGVVKDKVKNIFSIGAASQGIGMGVYVKL
jgi:hypothetical protein